MKFDIVSSTYFIQTLRTAQAYYKHIRQATTPWNEISQNDFSRYFINKDGSAGFVVSSDGELTSVYSAIKGRGDKIMDSAILHGACHLDCFDGYLVTFYARHGFQEVRREKNWTEGEPDVVYMEKN